MTKTHALCCCSIAIVLMLALPAADANAPLDKKILTLYPQADSNGDGILTDAEEDAVSRLALQRYPRSASGRRSTAGTGELRIGGQSVKTTVLIKTLRKLDKNQDGKLQQVEVPRKRQRFFDLFDTNRDNVLTTDEVSETIRTQKDR